MRAHSTVNEQPASASYFHEPLAYVVDAWHRYVTSRRATTRVPAATNVTA
jgi:hypothetical protein